MTTDDTEAIVARVRECFASGMVFFTRHARMEMAEEVHADRELPGSSSERHGDRIVVINDVPAEVCAICGDVLFTADTVRRIEVVVREAGAPDRMAPVYEYASSS